MFGKDLVIHASVDTEFGSVGKFSDGAIVVCVRVHYSGEGTVYHLDEMTGALVISHTLVISSKDYPGLLSA